MMNNKLMDYQAVDTLGKSLPDLVVKVYDGAISNLRLACKFYEDKDNQQGFEKLEKAKKFIVHLYTTLDEKRGGEIAEKLSRLYVFIVEQINICQATKELSLIEDSITILNNIRDGWVQLAEKLNKENASGNSGPVDSADGISMSI